MSSGEVNEASSQRKRNYKLLVDPELDPSAAKKVYRFDGILPGFKSITEPADPRIQKTVLGGVKPSIDIPVPRFKYDRFSVTKPPQSDVLLLGINETAQGELLKSMCLEVGPVYFIKYHRHPKTNAFLRAASVGFKRNGDGLLAEELLDGRMLCGRLIKVQLDDKGDRAREFLRDVVEGVTKKSSVDLGEHNIRRLSSSSSQKADDVAMNGARDMIDAVSDDSPTSCGHKLYPLSVLNINAGGVTPLYDTPSSLTNTSVPPTPSSLDSGVSLTVQQHDVMPTDKLKQLFTHSTLSCQPLTKPITSSLLNSKDGTDFLPSILVKPSLLAAETLPAPPQPSTPPNNIDDISISPVSVEGEVPDGVDKKAVAGDVAMVSPVSTSPVDSLLEYDVTKKPVATFNTTTLFPTQFDPTLGLQGLLHVHQSSNTAAPDIDLRPVSPPQHSDPAISVVSPPGIEVEEISGDESPEMIYMYSNDKENDKMASAKESYMVKVEQLSSDDNMEMSSDEETIETVIEVNPAPPPNPRPPIPSNHMLPYIDYQLPPPLPPPMPRPPNHVFPHPGMPPPLPFKHPLHPYFDPAVPPFHPPPHQVQLTPRPFHPYDSSPYRPPMFHPPRGSSKKLSLGLGSKEFLEEVKREVIMVVCQQLRGILLRDMRKKLVETSAFDSLDSFWERCETTKQERLQNMVNRTNEPADAKETVSVTNDTSQLPGSSKEIDSTMAAAEVPYRQLLPDQAEDEEKTPAQTPRKRLLNFKIPLLRRDGQRRNQGMSLVTRRRGDVTVRPSDCKRRRKPSVDSYSDISSASSSSDSEVSIEEANSLQPSPTPVKLAETDSNEESDDDSDIYEQFRQARKLSVRSVYSDNGSSDEEEAEGSDEEKDNLSREPRHASLPAIHPDHVYAKMLTIPESPHDVDIVVTDNKELDEASKRLRRAELLTAQARMHTFPARSAKRDEAIVHEFREHCGPDKEEVEMFKIAMARLKLEGSDLVSDVPWAFYPSVPPDPVPTPSKRRRLESHAHTTGSARCEGYYKIDPMDKKAYLRHSLPSFAIPTPRNAASKKEESLSRSRSNRVAHRRLASVFSTGDASTDIHKFNQLKARKKQLKFSKSRIHGWGLFALENIAADEMVIEYVGEVIRSSVADEREKRYEAAGIGSSYLFRMDQDYVIDATKKGSLARFINHCCDPNCYAKVINFGSQRKIVIYSKRDIKATEEITYDYKFPIEEEKIPCLCGAPNCRGTLN